MKILLIIIIILFSGCAHQYHGQKVYGCDIKYAPDTGIAIAHVEQIDMNDLDHYTMTKHKCDSLYNRK